MCPPRAGVGWGRLPLVAPGSGETRVDPAGPVRWAVGQRPSNSDCASPGLPGLPPRSLPCPVVKANALTCREPAGRTTLTAVVANPAWCRGLSLRGWKEAELGRGDRCGGRSQVSRPPPHLAHSLPPLGQSPGETGLPRPQGRGWSTVLSGNPVGRGLTPRIQAGVTAQRGEAATALLPPRPVPCTLPPRFSGAPDS